MREGTSLAENRSMKSLKLDSFITELNKKQNNKEIKRIKSDSCEGVGEILRPFQLLFILFYTGIVSRSNEKLFMD